MKIKAAVVKEKSGTFDLTEVKLSELRDDEILVRVVGVGICHTDIICRDQVYPVTFPAVFGHEGSGIVEQVGSRVNKVQPGDHVVMSFRSCGQCRNCKKGDPTHCDHTFTNNFGGRRSDGSATIHLDDKPIFANFFNQSSFATYALANEANTVKVSSKVPLDILGPLGCGFQTGAGAVMNTLDPPAGSGIAVFGCGSVGLAAVMAANVHACTTIIAIDPLAERRKLALELGATHAFDPSSLNVVEEILNLGGMDYSLDCTGIPSVLRQAVDCLKVPGVCALVGAAPMGAEVTLDMNSIMFGRSVVGVIEGESVADDFIPRLVELYTQGRFPIDKLVTFYSFDEIQQAINDSENGKVIKAILRP